jgi:chromosome segregation ATPase
VLGDSRDELLALEKEQREIREQGIETWTVLASSESNVFAQAKMLLEECEAAKKCFSAIYERKATIYAKEKQLERLAAEMQRFHAELQTQRQSVTSLETRIDHRSRALARRKEQYAATSAAQKERESDVKSRIEKIEALNAKVSSWIRIIETRDRELAAKEERLRNVQMELNRRGEVIAARRK